MLSKIISHYFARFEPTRTENKPLLQAYSLAFRQNHREKCGSWVSALVPAGTSFTLTLAPSSGSPVSYTLRSNTFTTEPIFIAGVGLASHALSAVTFGQPMMFSWTLPSTFPVAELVLDFAVFTGHGQEPGSFECMATNPPLLANTATSGAITIPASTCNGLPVVGQREHQGQGPEWRKLLCVFLLPVIDSINGAVVPGAGPKASASHSLIVAPRQAKPGT